MLYVITGATGHLGNNIARKLMERGERVKLLLRKPTPIFDGLNYEAAYGSFLDKDFLLREIPKDSIVIHSAGLVSISEFHKKELLRVNYGGTKTICDACMEVGAKKLVYVSSVHALPVPKDGVISEPKTFGYDVKFAYAKSKLLATEYVFKCANEGLDATVVYPSGIIGGSDYRNSLIGQLIKSLMRKNSYACVKGAYNFVDAGDVADAVINAAAHGKKGEGYILSGNDMSVEEMLKTISSLLGKKIKLIRVPMWLAKAFAAPVEVLCALFRIRPLYTPCSLYTLTSNHRFDNSKARAELGFKARPIEESFKEAIQFIEAGAE